MTRAESLERLRKAVALPPSGTKLLKKEVLRIADFLEVEYDEEWPKDRIIHRILADTLSGYPEDWAAAQSGERDYQYITMDEAEEIVEVIEDGY